MNIGGDEIQPGSASIRFHVEEDTSRSVAKEILCVRLCKQLLWLRSDWDLCHQVAPILRDLDEVVDSDVTAEFRWVHRNYSVLHRLKIRPFVSLRDTADDLVRKRAAPTTVGEHDHAVPRRVPHHVALVDCRSAMLEVNMRR